ncbi:unnamed protein product [Oncorhynchus mykiss]|uniref:SH3 domain-containing protein n=1 Tax=Oncorhynchus mykiss TaxID=8022 RepID=A0A060Y313_ONCMY|nr:unnamed protein product [Oncorhynchus mykiss]
MLKFSIMKFKYTIYGLLDVHLIRPPIHPDQPPFFPFFINKVTSYVTISNITYHTYLNIPDLHLIILRLLRDQAASPSLLYVTSASLLSSLLPVQVCCLCYQYRSVVFPLTSTGLLSSLSPVQVCCLPLTSTGLLSSLLPGRVCCLLCVPGALLLSSLFKQYAYCLPCYQYVRLLLSLFNQFKPVVFSYKPVAFAVRCNFYYIPADDDNIPVPGQAVTFEARDFLHVKEKFNSDWWLGRPVKEDGVVGFIPSPTNLETILIRRDVQARKAAKALASKAAVSQDTNKKYTPPSTGEVLFCFSVLIH